MKGSCFIILCLTSFFLHAQEEYPYPSLSPKGQINQVVGNTIMTIEYERPSVRKRKIYGGLVPWNQVWRTGAGHCTKISFDKAVMVGNQSVAAGKYALFTIPNQEKWIVILNRDTSLYGSYNYDSNQDVARFVTIPQLTGRFYETLNIDVELMANNARLYISWANTQVFFDVLTTTDQEMQALIDSLLLKKAADPNILAGAAEYLLYQNKDLFTALDLAEKAISIDITKGWVRNLKVAIYKKINLFEAALKEAQRALEYYEQTKKEKEVERQHAIKSYKKEIKEIQAILKQSANQD